MSAVALLTSLLVLAYVGSFLVGGRSMRGMGLPSGLEYILLGFVLGPIVLGLATRESLLTFEPVISAALAWLALVMGADYGPVGIRRMRPARLIAGISFSTVVVALAAASVYSIATLFSELSQRERMLIAFGVACAAGEMPRMAVRWVSERFSAQGPLTTLLGDLAEADDIVPLTLLALLFASEGGASSQALALPLPAWLGTNIGLGVILGGLGVLLLGRRFDREEAWGVVLGSSLIAMGLAERLGLSAMTAAFFLGLTLAIFSPHRRRLQAMLSATERPVMLPALLLAGARVGLDLPPRLFWLVAAAVMTRMSLKLIAGASLTRLIKDARTAGSALGPALVSAGPLGLAIGLACSLRFPGRVGAVILASVALSTLLGEFVGPVALRAVLQRAGDIPAAPPEPVSDNTEAKA